MQINRNAAAGGWRPRLVFVCVFVCSARADRRLLIIVPLGGAQRCAVGLTACCRHARALEMVKNAEELPESVAKVFKRKPLVEADMPSLMEAPLMK